MQFSVSSLSFKQKSAATELFFLFVINIMIPMAMGFQIWHQLKFTLCLVLVTSFQAPSIILLYRGILPVKNKWWLTLLLPVFVLIYELNARIAYIIMLALPFIPKEYKQNLEYTHPTDLSYGFIQNFGYTLLVILSASALYFIRELYKNQQSMLELATDKLSLELDHLKQQVQPHFFFNTLNNLYALSVQQSPKAPGMIADLSSIMRYVLYTTQQDKVSLQQEVDFIRSYIQLENVRHDNPNAIDFSIQGDASLVAIEPLLFLPLIENAFKHSLQKNVTDKWVKLVLAIDEDELIFQTTNPIDEQQETGTNEGGIGLKNVRKRLELLYPKQHQLTVHQDENTFIVTLTITLKR